MKNRNLWTPSEYWMLSCKIFTFLTDWIHIIPLAERITLKNYYLKFKRRVFRWYYKLMNEILCKKCIYWVDCHGDSSFCLQEDLFTATARTSCPNFKEGKPMTEEEYESYQYSEVINV